MVKPRREKTKPLHILVFGSIFLIILVFISYTLSEGVTLNPENLIIHTNLVYYDGKFSDTNKIEDLKTALYVLNQSDEVVYATVFEYDMYHKEIGFYERTGI